MEKLKVLYIFMFCIFCFNHLVEGEVNPVNDFIILHPLYGQKKIVVEFDFKNKIKLMMTDEINVELSSADTGLIEKHKVYFRPVDKKIYAVFDMKKLSAGVYQIKASVKDEYGDKLIDECIKEFRWLSKELEEFKWLNSKAGITEEVLAPWTPIKVEPQKDGKGLIVKVWGRTYQFNNSPFPTSIETKGESILAKPIKIIAKVDGKNVRLEWKPSKIDRQIPSIISFTQAGRGGGLNLSATTQIEYDGMIRVDWKIVPERSLTLEELTFEIQMPVKYAKYIYTSYHYGNIVGFIPKDRLIRKFEPMIWLGNDELGLEWFCESNKDWYNVKITKCIEVESQSDVVILRLRLVDKVIHLKPGVKEIHELGIPIMDPPDKVVELSYTFGIHATPIKPMEKDVWDYRFDHTGPGNHNIPINVPGSADKFNIPESAFNSWVRSGVRTIASQDFSDLYGCPVTTYDKDLKPIYDNALNKMIEGFHKHGLKIIFYLASLMSDLEPAWSLFKESFEGVPRSQSAGCFGVCGRSIWQDYIVDNIDRIMMKEYDLDGVYLDGVSIVVGGCKNVLHGCGYINSKGKLVRTHSIFPNREMIKRIYTVVKKHEPDGHVNLHNSLNMLAPALSFATSYWDGEHLMAVYMGRGLSAKDPLLKKIPLDYFRTEFMGVQWGVPAEFLECTLTAEYQKAFALSLLHDVPIRVHHFMSPIWKLFDEFGRKESEWLPYWRNKEYVSIKSEGKDVYVSLYKHPENGVLAVVSNLGTTDSKIQVQLNKEKLGLKKDLYAFNTVDTVHNGLLIEEPVEIIDSSTFELDVKSEDYKIIWVK